MSVPRALKLILIIALKTITKQQELADVSGGCMVTVDEVMYRGTLVAVLCVPLCHCYYLIRVLLSFTG